MSNGYMKKSISWYTLWKRIGKQPMYKNTKYQSAGTHRWRVKRMCFDIYEQWQRFSFRAGWKGGNR